MTSEAWQPTACILCECNCGIEIQLGGDDGRRFTKVRGDKAHPSSQGYACEKPSRLDHYQNSKARLTRPLRRRADGSFEEIEWDTAIREVARKLAAIRDEHGGERILYYGGGGQGNHLPAAYSLGTRHALGMTYSSSALAQEKTGEFWVSGRTAGGPNRADFEHCEVGIFLGKNPWFSHSIPRARVTLREIARDPERCLVVIDPRRTETADLADVHLAVRPGCDAWLLAAMVAILIQDDFVDRAFLDARTVGLEEVVPHFRNVPVADYCQRAGVDERVVRDLVHRIARAESTAVFEDLGVQMNRHSTLVSYLHRLLIFLTGHFGKKGTAYRPAQLVGIGQDHTPEGTRTPVTGSRIISGLMPCNVIPDEILTDHPDRFRAALVETANPVHSLADGPRMREAFEALELVVVIDVALTETARLADYVLPVATQFEKAEATFFNFEYPANYFHLRRPLLDAPEGLFSEAELHARLAEELGTLPDDAVKALREAWDEGREAFRACFAQRLAADPELLPMASATLYRAIGDRLPHRLAEGAAVWALCQMAAQRWGESIRRAGFTGDDPGALGDALFDGILAGRSGVVFAVDEWEESLNRVFTPDGKIHLSLPELYAELDGLASAEPDAADDEFPFILSAGERRSFTANTIFRDPAWRRKGANGALTIHPEDAGRLGIADGGRARITTRRGSAEVDVAHSDRMQPGHVSLPNGLGLDYPGEEAPGVSPNELTRSEDRDWLAGTPWHKYTPARIEAA
ncbi:MAG: molybdopterin-dependent oxidoreductase [Myxococcota bacterium]|nr:molybdopterin-dependent oxidoreductase [Myxococcota bacterium]